MKNKNRLILSISYGDYLQEFGGTNKVIAAHQEMMSAIDIRYLYIFPVTNKKLDKYEMWYLVDEGKFKGAYNTNGILLYISKVEKTGCYLSNIFLHHLKDIKPHAIKEILQCLKVPVIFYIHDYYSICIQYNLLKNEMEYCGGEICSNLKCRGCSSYMKSIKHTIYVNDIMNIIKNNLIVIAPSHVAKEVWCKRFTEFEKNVNIIYHQELIGTYKGNLKSVSSSEKLRVAFVGDTRTNKGWENWKDLILNLPQEIKNKYDFFVFGNLRQKLNGVTEVKVRVVKNLNAMVEALRKYEIDIAYIGSIWPETYAYTYYEAFAANTFIITNSLSGNVANQVINRKNGILFNSLNELISIFTNQSNLKKIVNKYKENGLHGPQTMIENRDILNLLSPIQKNSSVSFPPRGKQNYFIKSISVIEYKIYKYGRIVRRLIKTIYTKINLFA